MGIKVKVFPTSNISVDGNEEVVHTVSFIYLEVKNYEEKIKENLKGIMWIKKLEPRSRRESGRRLFKFLF